MVRNYGSEILPVLVNQLAEWMSTGYSVILLRDKHVSLGAHKIGVIPTLINQLADIEHMSLFNGHWLPVSPSKW